MCMCMFAREFLLSLITNDTAILSDMPSFLK